MVYTLIICPVCGEEERMDYSTESMAFCCGHDHDQGIAIEVVPRSVADELADEVEVRHAGENNRLSAALAKYREATK